MSVGAAIGVVAKRGEEVEICLWESDGLERGAGTMMADELAIRLVGMRLTSLGRVRESMRSSILIFVLRT